MGKYGASPNVVEKSSEPKQVGPGLETYVDKTMKRID